MGELGDDSGRAPKHKKRRKRRNHLGLQALSLVAVFFLGGVQIHSPRPILSQKVEFILSGGLETEVERLSVFSQLTARANHRLLPAEFLRTRELG